VCVSAVCVCRIDDSFDKLLQKTTRTVTSQQRDGSLDAEAAGPSQPSSSNSSKKPVPMTKPKLSTETVERGERDLSKPALPPKPKLKPTASLQACAASDEEDVEKRSSGIDAKLNICDVMKYIELNSGSEE